MSSSDRSVIIGIDLGTTNSSLSYILSDDPTIHQLPIPQVMGLGTVGENPQLPSFLYFPLTEEIGSGGVALPWDSKRAICVGFYAKERGKEVAKRLISSAKSWLCHDGVDRKEKLLPLGDCEQKMSPFEVIVEILKHLKEAFEYKMEGYAFCEQKVLITVPASFDPAARDLVQEAAASAGYPPVILLEEPQAALYAWLYRHEDSWRKQLQVGETLLVVDMGGGTTDFTLIAVEEEGGELALRRVAVGDHLLLGGDNLDLALAYATQDNWENQMLDDWQMDHLTHSCRLAKEQLLGEKPPSSVSVTIPGRGARLIGGALTTALMRSEVSERIVEGFFPIVPLDESVEQEIMGMQQIGLPYASDPRVTAQLAQFLTGGKLPTHVLFNGGTLKAAAIQKRLVEQLTQWAKSTKQKALKILTGDYDFAVSCGAAYYGRVCEGKGVRIRAGTSHSYYIGVQAARPAIPGLPTPIKALCIVPYGMEEGTETALPHQQFSLVLGQQVTFRFFARASEKLSNHTAPQVGAIVPLQELKELHPIEALLDRHDIDGRTVKVTLHSQVTELGMLELYCLSADGRKWKLEFNLRKEELIMIDNQ